MFEVKVREVAKSHSIGHSAEKVSVTDNAPATLTTPIHPVALWTH